MQSSVVFSDCNLYRYELRRVWDPSKPLVLFIGLNPSSTEATKDNSTSRVCMGYARRWGYGGLLLGNLFAYRSTDPTVLPTVKDPIGSENDVWLKQMQAEAHLVICAWTDLGALHHRDVQVHAFLENPHCLVQLKSGRPGHPLYKPAHLKPIPFMTTV